MRQWRKHAFSVIEIAVVAVILIIVAALTVPRFSQASDVSRRSEAKTHLDILRNAIERYRSDHAAWPAEKADGTNDAGTSAAFVTQLTQFSDADGNVSAVKTDRFCFGPYLASGIPACVIDDTVAKEGVVVITGSELPKFMATEPNVGWVYNCQTGFVTINSDQLDATGRHYDQY